MSGDAAPPTGPGPGSFWGAVDAKFLIITLAGLAGILGPVSDYLAARTKLSVDSAAANHKQRLDFLAELVRAQELKDEPQRVLARLDVLELLNGTLAEGDRLKDYVKSELEKTRSQYKALLDLQIVRLEVGEALAPNPPAPASTSSAAPPVPAAAGSNAPPAALPLASNDALRKLQTAQRQVAARVLVTSPAAIQQAQPFRPCVRIAADAPGTRATQAEIEAACRAADSGAVEWMARSDSLLVSCRCAAR